MEELNGTGESHDMENHIKETHAMLCDIEKDVHKLLNRGGTDSMGENFDSGMLAGLLSRQGVDPGIVAMLNDRTRDGNWGDGGGCWIILLFLFLLGMGGNGWGRNGFNNVDGVDRTVVNEANYSRMLDAIGGNREAISQLAQTLNCDCNTIQNALAGVDKQLAVNQGSIINAVQSCCCNIRTEVQSTQNAIQSQMAKCCCDTNLNIERQGCQTRQDIQDVRYLVQSTASAQDNLMQSMFSAQNAYLADQFCQIKSREDQREIQSLCDKLAEQRDSANTLAILNAIQNKDSIAFQGTAGATAFTGTGSLS